MSNQLPSIHPPRPQLQYTASPNYDSSPATSTISPQTPSSASGQGMGLLGPQIVRGPELDGRHPFPPVVQVSPLDAVAPYRREYDQMGGGPTLQDGYSLNRNIGSSPGMPSSHPGGSLQAHKRAYRQRRKDPSCDACRERKVKCDATDTTSCSECSSRNVKCQFTKETNRRMSSIKQVQDLEKQLLLARQQVSQLRSIVKTDTVAVDDDDGGNSHGPNKRRKLTNPHNAAPIQENMENNARGLIKPPSTKEQSSMPPMFTPTQIPELPPREVGQHLLNSYHTMLHYAFPFLNWSSVEQHFETLYNGASVKDVSADASAVLYGVFAVGALREDADSGKQYFDNARALLQFWTERPSLDLIRACLLSLVYLVETNHRTIGFALLGYVVRAAQDAGLHHKTNTRSAEEEDSRARLWWSIFCMERYLSFEVGRPTMINDEDCEPPDERAHSGHSANPMNANQFEFMVKVARTIPHIQKAFKTPVIPPGILNAIDEQINNSMSMFPAQHQPQSSEYVDPGPSSPVVYLQNARLLLHRHNLSPASPPDAKSIAVDRCMAVARDTARMFSRFMIEPPQPQNKSPMPSPRPRWEDSLRMASSAFLCLHIWRCTLFLAGSGDFERALICAQSSAAIGKHRPINASCGRYLEFFLEIVWHKFQLGRVNFADDDELLTYVSADLQSSLDQAWIWQHGSRHSTTPPATEAPTSHSLLHASDARDWSGWDDIVNTLRKLTDEQKRRFPQPPQHAQLPPQLSLQQTSSYKETSGGTFLAPRVENTTPTMTVAPQPSVSPGGTNNRMSIADLI